jgi:hypothetical protein
MESVIAPFPATKQQNDTTTRTSPVGINQPISNRSTSLSPAESRKPSRKQVTSPTRTDGNSTPSNLSPGRKHVQFGQEQDISPVMSRASYTKEELEASFYSPKQLNEIKDDFLAQRKFDDAIKEKNMPKKLPFGRGKKGDRSYDDDNDEESDRNSPFRPLPARPARELRPQQRRVSGRSNSENLARPVTSTISRPQRPVAMRASPSGFEGRRLPSSSAPRRITGSLSPVRQNAETDRQRPVRIASESKLTS